MIKYVDDYEYNGYKLGQYINCDLYNKGKKIIKTKIVGFDLSDFRINSIYIEYLYGYLLKEKECFIELGNVILNRNIDFKNTRITCISVNNIVKASNNQKDKLDFINDLKQLSLFTKQIITLIEEIDLLEMSKSTDIEEHMSLVGDNIAPISLNKVLKKDLIDLVLKLKSDEYNDIKDKMIKKINNLKCQL